MDLKIDKNPKIDLLEFRTKRKKFVDAMSPRNIIRQRGLEFDHFRNYQPDDDARLIDWKASARTSEILVRVYSEDISLNILLMVDVSETMIYGTQEKAKIEYAIEVALNIASGSLNYGDRVGLLTFNDKLQSVMPFSTGPEYLPQIISELENNKDYGGPKDLEYALGSMNELFKDTHLLIFISDFLGYDDLYQKFHAIIDTTDILAIMINDKTDYELDAGGFYLHLNDTNGLESGYVKGTNKLYLKENKLRIKELNDFFMITENELWVLFTDEPVEKIIRLTEERNSIK